MAIWTYLWKRRNHDFVLKEWDFKLVSYLLSPPFNFFNFGGSTMFPQSWISFMHYCKMLLSKCLMRIAVGWLRRVHVEHHFILGPLLLHLNSSISILKVFFSWFEGLQAKNFYFLLAEKKLKSCSIDLVNNKSTNIVLPPLVLRCIETPHTYQYVHVIKTKYL